MTISLNGLTQRDQLKSLLEQNTMTVLFVKRDGTERTMKCTLKSDLLPESDLSESTRTVNTDLLHVYDLENSGWRSFRLDSLITATVNNGN